MPRHRLGAGLVEITPVAAHDPMTVVLEDPCVPEEHRYCSRCTEPVGRSRAGTVGRTSGYCPSCRTRFSFTPKLGPGDLVGSQYEVVGCLAHGGLGWIYLARDRNVADRWVVLKGLLNTDDTAAMAAALAERRFLAEVEHPNVVKIHNFVEHRGDGYIVMEYVAGTSLRHLLEARRAANGGVPDPLPAAHAMAYVLEILPALGHLHKLGLLFCDFKPDNVMQTASSLKLIDLGGVYRADDQQSPIYGTSGYQAPEIAETGPTVASDLFTVARTLAVLCTDFRGYQSTYRYTLPPLDTVTLYTSVDSLYRFLERSTAPDPDDRFQSAQEMADQLLGVLREVVALDQGHPVHGVSTVFTATVQTAADAPDWRALPAPLVDPTDPAAGFLASVRAADPVRLLDELRAAPEQTIEVGLRIARTLVEIGSFAEAESILTTIRELDPWDWRVAWTRGLMALAFGVPASAHGQFMAVYRALPGELAPKLALGFASESRDAVAAARWYDVVSRTGADSPSAAFGLARCRVAQSDRHGAVEALDRVPETSSAYVDAQVAKVKVMLDPSTGPVPDLTAILAAASVIERLGLDEARRAELTAITLEAALIVVPPDSGDMPVLRRIFGTAGPKPVGATAQPPPHLFGRPLTETDVRFGLERAYRRLARNAATDADRIVFVDLANRVRPRTIT